MLIKLLKELIKSQNEINESLKNIRKDLEPKLEDIRLNANTLTSTNITVNKLDNYIESNVYTKEQTVNAINKECDYRDSFKECDEKNPALLQLIEEYFRYDDKYEIIDLFRRVDSLYEVKTRK